MTEPTAPREETFAALLDLQRYCHDSSAARGFAAEGNFLRNHVAEHATAITMRHHETNLRNYYANRLMLVVGELAEAHEELRVGHAMDETYYPTMPVAPDDALASAVIADPTTGAPIDAATGVPFKPEGVPSELADVVIRILDLADEAGIDMAAIVREKLAYNATRARMHGKRF